MRDDYFRRVYLGPTRDVTKVLPTLYPDLSYGLIKRLLDKKDVFVNGKRISGGVVPTGATLSLFVTAGIVAPKIAYQDDNILVLCKPKGVESTGEVSFEALAQYCYGDVRLMHRLDTNTNGLLLFSRSEMAYDAIYHAMKEGEIVKTYRALVWGRPEVGVLSGYLQKDSDKGLVRIFDQPVQGAVPVSCEIVWVEPMGETATVTIELHGGKTHQLRAQLAHSGHFILGDSKYGDDRVNKRLHYKKQQLEACALRFEMKGDPLGLNGKTISLPQK